MKRNDIIAEIEATATLECGAGSARMSASNEWSTSLEISDHTGHLFNCYITEDGRMTVPGIKLASHRTVLSPRNVKAIAQVIKSRIAVSRNKRAIRQLNELRIRAEDTAKAQFIETCRLFFSSTGTRTVHVTAFCKDPVPAGKRARFSYKVPSVAFSAEFSADTAEEAAEMVNKLDGAVLTGR